MNDLKALKKAFKELTGACEKLEKFFDTPDFKKLSYADKLLLNAERRYLKQLSITLDTRIERGLYNAKSKSDIDE